MKLKFPETDSRSNGVPLSKKRPWLFQGAKCRIIAGVGSGRVYRHTVPAQFEGAPEGNFDLVSPEFLRSR